MALTPFKSSWITNKFVNNDDSNKYITVTKFSQVDSGLISSALSDSNSKVYFADDGGVLSINKTKHFKNGLTNKSVPPDYSSTTIVTLPSGDNKYVFSKPNGEWVLYRKNNNEVSLLYNPIPRPEWTKALIQNETKTFTNMIETCSLVNAADPVCKCIDGRTETPDTNFCMNDLLGNTQTRKAVKQMNDTAYGQLLDVCACSNGSCDRSHPFFKEYRKSGGSRSCDRPIMITVCNSSFNAGKDLKTGDVNIQQSCGGSMKSAESPKTSADSPQSSTPSSSPTTSPQSSSTPSSSAEEPSSTPSSSTEESSSTPSSQDSPPPTKFSLSTLTMTQKLIIGGVILLIVILILVAALSGDDNKPQMPYGPPPMPYPQSYGPQPYPPMR